MDAALASALSGGREVLGEWLCARLGVEARLPLPVRLEALLGCGPGLTPSGDDMLVGALVLLHGTGQRGAARELGEWVIRHAPRRTGRISAAHLQAAAAGEAVAPLHRMVAALVCDDAGAIQAGVTTLARHGARSGLDALDGVLLAAAALCRQDLQASVPAKPPVPHVFDSLSRTSTPCTASASSTSSAHTPKARWGT
jgi:hypothetical protein